MIPLKPSSKAPRPVLRRSASLGLDQSDEPARVSPKRSFRGVWVTAQEMVGHVAIVLDVLVPEGVGEVIGHMPVEVFEVQAVQDRVQVRVARVIVNEAMVRGDRVEEVVTVAPSRSVRDRPTAS